MQHIRMCRAVQMLRTYLISPTKHNISQRNGKEYNFLCDAILVYKKKRKANKMEMREKKSTRKQAQPGMSGTRNIPKI